MVGDVLIASGYGWLPVNEINVDNFIFDRRGDLTPIKEIIVDGDDYEYQVNFTDDSFTKYHGKDLITGFNTMNIKKNRIITDFNIEELYKKGVYIDNNNIHQYQVLNNGVAKYVKDDLPTDPYLLGCLIAQSEISNKSYKLLKQLSGDGRIPEKYLISDYRSREELIRGMMDTRGNLLGGSSYTTYSSSDPIIILQFKEIINSLGGMAIYVENAGARFRYMCKFILPINPFKKNDKVNRYKSDPFKMVRKIRSITPLDIKSTYYKIVPKLSDEPILISKHYLPIK